MPLVFEEKINNYAYIYIYIVLVILFLTVHNPVLQCGASPGLCRHLVVAFGTLFSGNNGPVFSQSIKLKLYNFVVDF